MAITYFNWYELLKLSRRDKSAIICLAYAQTLEYYEVSATEMRERLNLHHLPVSLFSPRLFVKHKHFLECKYKTIEPQSYFNNSSFLFTNASADYKVEYLKVLSLRNIANKTNYIPASYYDLKGYNPFFEVENDKIKFTFESS